MSRDLSVNRLQTVFHEQGWHWALRLDAVLPAADVTFFDATMGFGWDGFKQRKREYPTLAVAMEQMPIVDDLAIGVIDADRVESALIILQTCPVSADDSWNCQNWVRDCVKRLYESQHIQEANYEAFCVWNDNILAGYNATQPVFKSMMT